VSPNTGLMPPASLPVRNRPYLAIGPFTISVNVGVVRDFFVLGLGWGGRGGSEERGEQPVPFDKIPSRQGVFVLFRDSLPLPAVPVFVHTCNCTSNEDFNIATFSDAPDNSTRYYEWRPALPPAPTAKSCRRQRQCHRQRQQWRLVATGGNHHRVTNGGETVWLSSHKMRDGGPGELFFFLSYSLPSSVTAGVLAKNQGESGIRL
jgi:hypothetical protein